jgi:hypothetical protein
MKIKIQNSFHEGKEYFEFELLDGPDEVEHVTGYSTDLINAFTKILEWSERISRDYGTDP